MKKRYFFSLLAMLLVVELIGSVGCTSLETTPEPTYPYSRGG